MITVWREIENRRAISAWATPSAASSTIRARSTKPAFVVEERTHCSNVSRSLSDTVNGAARIHNSTKQTPPNYFRRAALVDPEHADEPDARGEAITSVALSSLVELPWPARLQTGNHIIRGRAYAGENRVSDVQYRLDDEPWRTATITSASSPGVWARWEFSWAAEPGEHLLRVRAIDDRGYVQPESTPGNALGYQHGSVLAHPLHVEEAGS